MIKDTLLPMQSATQDLDQLRRLAAHAPEQALKGAARQFEALFLNTLLKSMREASAGESIFDNEQTKLYTAMLDQQFAQSMSTRGIGLAEMMAKQLAQQVNAQPGAAPVDSTSGTDPGKSIAAIDALASKRPPTIPRQTSAPTDTRSPIETARTAAHAGSDVPQLASARASALNAQIETLGTKADAVAMSREAAVENPAPHNFVQRLLPHTRAAAEKVGVPERFLLGHAALESGWGRRELHFADGSTSHNLFGIKADKGWSGKSVEVTTTEYLNGKRVQVKEKFRAYDSYTDAFNDYVRFLHVNPRYAHLLQRQHDAVSFAQGLQRAGYATDPHYADKLAGVINGRSMRRALA